MDKQLEEIEKLTEALVLRLDQATAEDLLNYIEKRQLILDQILDIAGQQSINSLQKEKLKAITRYDSQIAERMNYYRQEAADWLHQRKQAKLQRNAYEISYSPNSILMDRRK
jgi:hypothetical protein